VTAPNLKKSKLDRLGHWLLKYVLIAFFVYFVVTFSILNFSQLYLSQKIEDLFLFNIILSLLLGLTLTIMWDLFWLSFKIVGWMESKLDEIRPKGKVGKSVEARIALRKYFLIASCCFALLGIISLSFAIRNFKFSLVDMWLFPWPSLIFISFSLGFLGNYATIISAKEFAVFYLTRFSRQFESSRKENWEFSIKDLSRGLGYYQKSLPSHLKLKSLNRRVGQIQLVLERSSGSDLTKLVSNIGQIIETIEGRNNRKFDEVFLKLVDFLDLSEESKALTIEVKEVTRRERIRNYLSPIAKSILEKIIYVMIGLIVLLIIVWLGLGQYLGNIKI
jgi:hypothetical protein